MNKTKLIAALAVLGSLAVVSSRASALVCYSPAPGLFTDIVEVFTLNQSQINLTCESQPTGGTRTKVEGYVTTSTSAPKNLGANLTAGPSGAYARGGAYGANRQGLGCFIVDQNPTSQSIAVVVCSATVRFIDMEIGKP